MKKEYIKPNIRTAYCYAEYLLASLSGVNEDDEPLGGFDDGDDGDEFPTGGNGTPK